MPTLPARRDLNASQSAPARPSTWVASNPLVGSALDLNGDLVVRLITKRLVDPHIGIGCERDQDSPPRGVLNLELRLCPSDDVTSHDVSDGEKDLEGRLTSNRVVVRPLELRAERQEGQFSDVTRGDLRRDLANELCERIGEQRAQLRYGCPQRFRQGTMRLQLLEPAQAAA